ncbi:MAG: glucose-1-phosphate thymidylyltransferase [Rhodopirellula sp. TMED11]|nr:MAG: glucose-1-phosphate thymidylyltransferase [Rhodopirellula sp. TMED11]
MHIICFEDDLVNLIFPITLARPAYAITCASRQLVDWLKLLDGSLSVSIRSYLAEIQRLDHDLTAANIDDVTGSDVLLVNARLVPSISAFESLKTLIQSNRAQVIRCETSGAILAARLTPQLTQAISLPKEAQSSEPVHQATSSPFAPTVRQPTTKPTQIATNLTTPNDGGLARQLIAIAETIGSAEDLPSLPAFNWPHEVILHHMQLMPEMMQWRLTQGGYKEIQDGLFVGEDVTIGQYAVVECDDGPILLDQGVNVGPFCFLSGPVYAGPKTRVIEHAALKDGVALGHTVKIGGEVEASVIEPYTNKQHHGFLGHSYLGSWINLGAGTCNSDLKNTYGKVNIQYNDRKIASGMQFLGCIMGDYSKTAINTSIFTGKVIGACSMLYGFATANVPSFVNDARLFGQRASLPAEVMVNTQQRMFARRKVPQRPCDIQLIQDMYQLTISEREIASENNY